MQLSSLFSSLQTELWGSWSRSWMLRSMYCRRTWLSCWEDLMLTRWTRQLPRGMVIRIPKLLEFVCNSQSPASPNLKRKKVMATYRWWSSSCGWGWGLVPGSKSSPYQARNPHFYTAMVTQLAETMEHVDSSLSLELMESLAASQLQSSQQWFTHGRIDAASQLHWQRELSIWEVFPWPGECVAFS